MTWTPLCGAQAGMDPRAWQSDGSWQNDGRCTKAKTATGTAH